jgi:hypothetical protein
MSSRSEPRDTFFKSHSALLYSTIVAHLSSYSLPHPPPSTLTSPWETQDSSRYCGKKTQRQEFYLLSASFHL